jgi:hypothetical protein
MCSVHTGEKIMRSSINGDASRCLRTGKLASCCASVVLLAALPSYAMAQMQMAPSGSQPIKEMSVPMPDGQGKQIEQTKQQQQLQVTPEQQKQLVITELIQKIVQQGKQSPLKNPGEQTKQTETTKTGLALELPPSKQRQLEILQQLQQQIQTQQTLSPSKNPGQERGPSEVMLHPVEIPEQPMAAGSASLAGRSPGKIPEADRYRHFCKSGRSKPGGK